MIIQSILQSKNIAVQLKFPFFDFRKGGFIDDSIKLLSGNLVAQILIFVFTPVITRLYAPTEIGAMSFISSFISVLAILIALRFDQVVFLTDNNDDAYIACILAFYITIIVTSLISITLVVFVSLTDFKTEYSELLWLIPVGSLISGWNNILVSFNLRAKLFKTIAYSQILVSVLSLSIKLLCGNIGAPFAVWLIMGNAIGVLAGSLLLLYGFKNCLNSKPFKFSISRIFKLASQYRKFPLYGTINGFLESISQHLPIFVLGYLFSSEIVGYYGIGSVVLRKPIQLMGVSFGKVFIQRASKYINTQKSIKPILRNATIGLAAIAFIPFGIMFFFGSNIFSFIFGPEWECAGTYCQILTPSLFFVLISKPSTQTLIVKQDLKFVFYLMIFSIILRGSMIFAGFYFYRSAVSCLIFFSIADILIVSINIQRAFALSRKDEIFI